MIIQAQVLNRVLSFSDGPKIYSGTENADQIQITLDDEWESYTKRVVFRVGPKCYFSACEKIEDNVVIAKIPSNVFSYPGVIQIGIVGDLSNKRITSSVANYEVDLGAGSVRESSGKVRSLFHKHPEILVNYRTKHLDVPDGLSIVGVKGDQDSRRLHFRMQKISDEIDLSESNILINYVNALDQTGEYLVEDAELDGEDVVFTFLIPAALTKKAGKVSIEVHVISGDKFWNIAPYLFNIAEFHETDTIAEDDPKYDIVEQLIKRLNDINVEGKVDKDGDKVLSTNDYTTADKTKLAGIETGAQANKVEAIKLNGQTLPITSKAVDVKFEVGGRNLLPGTKTGNGFSTPLQTTQNYQGCLVAGKESFPNGETEIFSSTIPNVDADDTYTVSFWAKGTSPYVYVYFYNQSGIGVLLGNGKISLDGYNQIALSTDWKRYFVTYQLVKHENYTGPGNRHLLIRGNADAEGKSIYIAGVKLEHGTIPTDWTPAPEDVDNRLSPLETKVAQLESKLNNILAGGTNVVIKQ